jgi:pentatricopeptide repeat protein
MLGTNRGLVFLPELAYAYSRVGRSDDVRRVFEEMKTRETDPALGAGSWAIAYLAIGDVEEALRWLDVAAEKARTHAPDPGFLHLMNLKMNFLDDPLLDDSRFVEALRRVRGT